MQLVLGLLGAFGGTVDAPPNNELQNVTVRW